MKFDLPENVKLVIDTIISNGHKAYIVGGCVRDLLCRKQPHDYDITTSATPDEIKSMFKKTVDTGIKHGTVTVILSGGQIEVTTFRCDGKYTDSRRPDKVEFVTDVTQDLARRDFTVNAMCYNDYEGLIDCFGGIDDIKNRVLRAVGDAETRFREDALRILRLLRFAATLEFNIEKLTFDAAIKCACLLENISAERIFAELKKASEGENTDALSPLIKCGALKKYCIENTEQYRMAKLEQNKKLRVFALLNLTSTDICKTLDMLKCDNAFKDYCKKMSRLCNDIFAADKISIKRALNFAGESAVNDLLVYCRDVMNVDTTAHKTLLDEIIRLKEPYIISQLNISGKDLTNLGIMGKDVGHALEFLLSKVIEEPNLNKREKLIDIICN